MSQTKAQEININEYFDIAMVGHEYIAKKQKYVCPECEGIAFEIELESKSCYHLKTPMTCQSCGSQIKTIYICQTLQFVECLEKDYGKKKSISIG